MDEGDEKDRLRLQVAEGLAGHAHTVPGEGGTA